MKNRPAKPYPEFPLFANQNGQWCRKVNKRPYYFGRWATDLKGETALADWLARKDAIENGTDQARAVRPESGMMLKEAITQYLVARQANVYAGTLSDLTFSDYARELNSLLAFAPAARLAAYGPNEFSAYLNRRLTAPESKGGRNLGPHKLASTIRYIRAFFNYAANQGWRPAVVYGADFVPPATDPDAIAARRIRLGLDADADPIFTRRQIKWLLRRASPMFKAMILLSLNCGMGPSDVAALKWKHIDFTTGRLSMRRGKNGIRRECYLWKKTRVALLAVRKLKRNKLAFERDGDNAIVFVTREGHAVVRRERKMAGDSIKTTTYCSALATTFGRMIREARKAKIITNDAKLSYYSLRHTYYTYAENHADLNAVSRTVGHALHGMGKRYKHKAMPLPRLKRVAMSVRRAIWPAGAKPAPLKLAA